MRHFRKMQGNFCQMMSYPFVENFKSLIKHLINCDLSQNISKQVKGAQMQIRKSTDIFVFT